MKRDPAIPEDWKQVDSKRGDGARWLHPEKPLAVEYDPAFAGCWWVVSMGKTSKGRPMTYKGGLLAGFGLAKDAVNALQHHTFEVPEPWQHGGRTGWSA